MLRFFFAAKLFCLISVFSLISLQALPDSETGLISESSSFSEQHALDDNVDAVDEQAVQSGETPEKEEAFQVGKPLVVPSFRQQKLEIYLPVSNFSEMDMPVDVTAELYDENGEQHQATFGPVQAVIKAGSFGKDIRLEFPVEGLAEWFPDMPYLYTLILEISRDGDVVGMTAPERFGFREVWVESGDILINGKRLNIRGVSFSGDDGVSLPAQLMRSVGMNAARLTEANIAALDTADKHGIVVSMPVNIDISDREKAPRVFRERLGLFGNHPSLIMLEIGERGSQNRLDSDPAQIGGVVDEEKHETDPFVDNSDFINEIDPTGRLMVYHGSGVGGNVRAANIPQFDAMPADALDEWLSLWSTTQQQPLLLEIPDLRLWCGGESAAFDASFRFNREIVARVLRTYGISGYWLGDASCLRGFEGQSDDQSIEIFQKFNYPVVLYISGPESNFTDKAHNYFSDESVSKSAVVINDTFRDISGTLTWEAVAEDNTVIASSKASVTVPQGRRLFRPVAFRCPEADGRSEIAITTKFSISGEPRVLEDSFRVTVFSKPQSVLIAKPIAVLDDDGYTIAVIREMQLPHVVVTKDNKPDISSFDLLLIGENSLSKVAGLLDVVALNAAIENGLNVIVFPQMNRNVAGLITECRPARDLFVSYPGHSLLAGLEQDDFCDWRGTNHTLRSYSVWSDRDGDIGLYEGLNSFGQPSFKHWSSKGIVATFCYQKPHLGNFSVLLENDARHASLIEFRKGRGKILFSQLDLLGRYNTEPVSAILLHKIIDQYSNPVSGELAPLALQGGVQAKAFLDTLGVKYMTELGSSVVYVALDEIQDMEQIEKFINKGGTVVVSIKKRDGADKLPVDISLEERAENGFVAFAPGTCKTLVSDDPVFRGITTRALSCCGLTTGALYVASVNGEPTDNGLLGSVSFGKGRIIYVQPVYDTKADALQKAAAVSLYNMIFTNLGVKNIYSPDFSLIGGLGVSEEWIPADLPENRLEKRPMVEQSPLYLR